MPPINQGRTRLELADMPPSKSKHGGHFRQFSHLEGSYTLQDGTYSAWQAERLSRNKGSCSLAHIGGDTGPQSSSRSSSPSARTFDRCPLPFNLYISSLSNLRVWLILLNRCPQECPMMDSLSYMELCNGMSVSHATGRRRLTSGKSRRQSRPPSKEFPTELASWEKGGLSEFKLDL